MDAGQPGLSPSRARSLRPHTPTSVPAFLPQPVSMVVLGDGEALFDQLEEEKSQACFIDRPSWYVGPSQHLFHAAKETLDGMKDSGEGKASDGQGFEQCRQVSAGCGKRNTR